MSTGTASLARRLTVLRWLGLAVALVLAGRLIQVQVLQHEHWREEAQRQWLQARVIPAHRGDLLDRDGRPLALTVSSHRVGVSGSLVEDRQELATVLADVLGGDVTARAGQLAGLGTRYRVLDRQAFLDHAQLRRLAAYSALNVQEQLGRVYPHDGVGASLVGFSRIDPDSARHLTGLELGLDDLLSGQPGRAMRVRSGHLGKDHGDVIVEPARHGHDVVLSLDADLQEICEARLAAAVPATESQAGSILVMDPRTGDVLAAASWPLLATRQSPVGETSSWINRNFTSTFEPGSAFKIFTAAALLSYGGIDTAMVFDCRQNQFRGFTIREAAGHEYGRLSFMAGFARSSNVWFARSVANLAPHEHHRTLVEFGFGHATGAAYPGERDGSLEHPDDWSHRSQATIAIGQEVSVTPLQLGLAVSAVANGGTLYAPRLVLEVRDQDGRIIQKPAPRALRRVLPQGVDEIIREAMARVVSGGTGTVVQRDWVTIAGKTGTAQKSVQGEGYSAGLHTATFVGFLPDDQPRLVIVVVLDEPSLRYHYAAQSAAPLFADVVDDIRRTTRWLTDPARVGVPVVAASTDDLVTVPDVLFLDAERATERLSLAGLAVVGRGATGEVVMQIPAGGSRVARGAEVALTVRGPDISGSPACPDLSGLSNRQVTALAARLGLPLRIEGVGYVQSQDPEPGGPVSAAGVLVRMATPWQ